MSYNETLQGNNARLQELLAKVNALPEAGGGTVDPVLQSKTVSPATSEQVVTPDEGYDGLSDVTVEAVALQSKIIIPSASEQTVAPDSGYDGLSQVTVEGDSNLVPANIVSGVSIFGVEGSAESGGSDGSLERCSVSVKAVGPIGIMGTLHYNNGIEYRTINEAGDIQVLKNSIIGVIGATDGIYVSGSCELLYNGADRYSCTAVLVSGGGSIKC